MALGKKAGFLLLVAVVLSATTPVFACLPLCPHRSMPACCRGMVRECGPAGTGASRSCCQARSENALLGTVPPRLMEHNQALMITLHVADLLIASTSDEVFISDRVLPPKAPPGTLSILRI